jgi:NADPH-dependent 2,4-dienoyl-CoA reductase/sulfur reductase-like enzyme
MKVIEYDAVVVGGGAAGMAAAAALVERGFRCAVCEREAAMGGILLQCIHNGFGVQEFKKELTGPEYAEEWLEQVTERKVPIYLETTVIDIETSGGPDGAQIKQLYCFSPRHGAMVLRCRAVVLTMGCRERNRGNIRIPGDRPAGVYTAGLAQRLVNVEGYIPGKKAVIIGSGDIGLIMARRMTWVGSTVEAVVEIQPYPSGLTRNIVQCLNDFDIPLYLSHVVSRIEGRERVERVEVTPLENGVPDPEQSFWIDCDTVLLSVGLIPENELSKKAGIELSRQTGGPHVDSRMMTSVPGIFAAGNVLHVHDLVDYVTEEARRTGEYAVSYLRNEHPQRQVPVRAGANVRYVNPGSIDTGRANRLYLRTLIVKNGAYVELKVDNHVIRRKKELHVQPSEMISVDLRDRDLANATFTPDSVLEVSVS